MSCPTILLPTFRCFLCDCDSRVLVSVKTDNVWVWSLTILYYFGVRCFMGHFHSYFCRSITLHTQIRIFPTTRRHVIALFSCSLFISSASSGFRSAARLVWESCNPASNCSRLHRHRHRKPLRQQLTCCRSLSPSSFDSASFVTCCLHYAFARINTWTIQLFIRVDLEWTGRRLGPVFFDLDSQDVVSALTKGG